MSARPTPRWSSTTPSRSWVATAPSRASARYRDVPVQESWEGPHNTLMAQLLRDALRAKMHEPLLGAAQEILLGVREPSLAGSRDRALAALDEARGGLRRPLPRAPGGGAPPPPP